MNSELQRRVHAISMMSCFQCSVTGCNCFQHSDLHPHHVPMTSFCSCGTEHACSILHLRAHCTPREAEMVTERRASPHACP
jgi:hypothetical protein